MMELSKANVDKELQAILNYWRTKMVDPAGGFFGRIDENERVDTAAAKGVVLNARILWTFSACWNYTRSRQDFELAQRAADYMHDHFTDLEAGGVYWSVTANGQPLDTKKQIYAQAFAIYGLSAFYRIASRQKDLQLAIDLFRCIEQYSVDRGLGGYLEAFSREWTELADLRLSEKDANEKKTMNTHLHILEAYTLLYQVWPDATLKNSLRSLLDVFADQIYDHQRRHLRLFMNEKWESKLNIVSFGHDIEASWLLLEAAQVLGDAHLLTRVQTLALELADASLEGIAADGAMIYEYDADSKHMNNERHWWVQAEAMVGFLTAAQLSGDSRFYSVTAGLWDYTAKAIIDRTNGEWYWGRKGNGELMPGEDKAGFWKCPYHNSRACLELLNRL
ncbi:AGE family epimerase/isomerase [Pedobacter sp. SYP-B3415]|uniref:AGE family epimerase/isomerase n=1 Tax=Pedobacter sp. SYP-B3415 TaxID=2496641 RepID=UPI0013ECCBE5|nr:AGE family epimerase/isomerase [Pedobacter sp. SYP-B3415]